MLGMPVARLIESRGAKSIATTSAGVAWSHGYPDGDALLAEILLASIRATLSVDIQGGYSDDSAP
jgi:2-methylisocitrate lyase-like PEP mutase family enzyme